MIIGATWIDTDVYRVGEVLQEYSNCTSEETKQCRWIELDTIDNYYCDNYNKYSFEVEECTEDGLIWTRTGEFRKGATLIEEKSSDCGWYYVTTEIADEIAFEYSGDEELVYSLNYNSYTASSSPYSATLSDLGLETIVHTQFAFDSTKLTNLLKFPSLDKVPYMDDMFAFCKNLKVLDLSNFTTRKAYNMERMFYACDELIYLDISNFSTFNEDDCLIPISLKSMFEGCSKLNTLNISNFTTKNTVNMSSMFNGCRLLTSLDLSSFDTSKVTNMSNMFGVCRLLTSLDLSHFNTSNVENMEWLFNLCRNLKTLNVTGWDVLQVKEYEDMFYNCNSLTEVILGEVSQAEYDWWCARLTEAGISCDILKYTIKNDVLAFEFTGDTATYILYNTIYTATTSPYITTLDDLEIDTLTSCYLMFSGSSISNLISFPDTSNVTDMTSMFYHCSGLTTLDLSSFDTSNVTRMGDMFMYSSGLTSLNLSSFDTSKVTSMSNMFGGCSSLTSLDLSNFNTSAVTSMYSMFYDCSSLTSLDVSSFNTSGITSMQYMFSNCRSLTSLDLSSFDTSNVTDMGGMFGGCSGLTSLDLSSFDTSNVTDMGGMFGGCSGLTSLDVSSFDTSNVTSMGGMFYDCKSLTTLIIKEGTYDWWCLRLADAGISCDIIVGDSPSTEDVLSFEFSGDTMTFKLNDEPYSATSSPYSTTIYELGIETLTGCNYTFNSSSITNLTSFPDTSNVTNMSSMFYGCSGLTSLDLSSFNTSAVTSMGGMFSNCRSLTSLDVSSFNTSAVTSMSTMFYGCSGLTSLDLSSFNTSAVTNMSDMFYGCSGLTSLDLSNFNTSNVTSIYSMFNGCSGLTSLDVSSWDVNHITSYSSMFWYCTSLTELKIKEGTYEWWCARLTEAGISCDIIVGDSPTPDTGTTDTLSFEFTATTMTYKLNGTIYTATTSPYSTTLSDLGIETLTSCDDTFYRSSITKLISFPDTSNVTNMNYMFDRCSSLISIDLTSFNTSNVTGLNAMFMGCNSLPTLDLSSFNTSNVTIMHQLFDGCSSLQTLNVSSWDVNHVESGNTMRMFASCTSLTELKIKEGTYDWWLARLTDAGIQSNVTITSV